MQTNYRAITDRFGLCGLRASVASDLFAVSCEKNGAKRSGPGRGDHRRVGRDRPRDGAAAGARRGGIVALRAARRPARALAPARSRRPAAEALTVVADVTREDDMNGLVARAVERFGRLDVMMCNAGFGIYGAHRRHRARADAEARWTSTTSAPTTPRARRCPCSAARARPRHHRVVDRRQARRAVHGRVLGDQVRAGRPRRVPASRGRRARASTSASSIRCRPHTEFIEVMLRETGTAITRPSARRQTAEQVADAIARAIARPVPEVYPYTKSRGLVWLNAIAPGFCDRLVKKYGRQPVKSVARGTRPRAAMTDTSFERALAIAEAVRESRRPRADRRRLGPRSADGTGGSRTSTSRCSACRPTACARCSRRWAASRPSARAFRSTRPATSTCRCRAANRNPDAAIRGSRSPAIRT